MRAAIQRTSMWAIILRCVKGSGALSEGDHDFDTDQHDASRRRRSSSFLFRMQQSGLQVSLQLNFSWGEK